MKKRFSIEDTCATEESKQFYSARSWKELAEKTVLLSAFYRDYARFLPACNGWNLDYPEPNESAEEYRARLISMAVGLQLLG